MRPNQILTHTAAIMAALTLAACGGGGGDSQPVPGPADPVVGGPPAVPAGQPVAYAAGSASALALDFINRQIGHCGYPAMTPVADLTGAARGHVNYISANGEVTHIQDPARPGFTGLTYQDRIIAAGGTPERANTATEGAGGLGYFQANATVNLLAGAYHQTALLSQFTEIGVGISPENISVNDLVYGAWLVINPGGPQRNEVPENAVRTFPCEGSANIAGGLGRETPDPLPGRDPGSALNFETNHNGAITVDSVTVRNQTTGQIYELVQINDFNLPSQPFRSVWLTTTPMLPGLHRVEAKGVTFASKSGNDSPVSFERRYSFHVDF